MMSETLIKNAIILLKDLIKIKSFSGYEDKSADKIEEWLSHNKKKFSRKYNNIWAYNNFYDKIIITTSKKKENNPLERWLETF